MSSNKRQWYAIRDDLRKRGLWRYADAHSTKKVRTGSASAKRTAEEAGVEDNPEEGTSTAAKRCK